jgi:hypothetical protein
MVNVGSKLYPKQEQLVNDISSGNFNTFLGIGQVLAPIFGAYMTEQFNF